MAFAAENKPLFGKGMFTIDPNATPEQIATKRALMQAIMPRFGSARYVGEGLGQLATGVAMGARGRKLDKIEGDNRAKADAMFSGVLGGAMGGPMNILGVDPSYGQAPAAPVDPNSPAQIGADTMSALGKDPASLVKQGLVARGMPEHIADGFVMNFKDESGLNPGINEQAPIVPGSRGGFGLAQWTGPRRRALEQFAAAQGKPVSDMNVQLDFLMTELQGPESSAWQKIAAAPDAGTAGAAIVNSFLRPAEEHRTRRAAAYSGGSATGGNPATSTAIPQIPMDQLMALMSNPWLAPEQRSMLETMMAQQMQAGDPMRQVELQKAQFELDQMENPPPPAPPEEYTNRIFMAQQAGLEPGSPEFQNYLLTGELPQPEQAQKPYSSAGEIQADLRAGFITQEQADMAMGKLGGGVSVTNVLPGGEPDDGALRKKLSEKEGEAWSAYMDSGTISSGTMQDMQLLDELITMAPQGPISGRIAGAFPGVNSAADAFTSVVKRVAPTLRAPGSGATSDIEYEGMLKSLPQLSSRPEANAAISGMMKAKAQINVERGQIVSRYQNGEISAAEARASINDLNNRSIISPELKSLIDGLAPAAVGAAPDGIDQADWEAMTPEGRALWD